MPEDEDPDAPPNEQSQGSDSEGTVVTPAPRFPRFDSTIRWLADRAGYIAAGSVLVALIGLWIVDGWVLQSHGSMALGQAVQAEAEIWIAGAATVGLWATARHVRGLASAIRYRALADAVAGTSPRSEGVRSSDEENEPAAQEGQATAEEQPNQMS
jgi:hypothetical protein